MSEIVRSPLGEGNRAHAYGLHNLFYCPSGGVCAGQRGFVREGSNHVPSLGEGEPY